MKFIGSQAGIVADRISVDDILPPRGVMARDIVAFLNAQYNFSVLPQIHQGIPPSMIPLIFHSGQFVAEDARIPIINLAIVLQGFIITAPDTDLAELILNDCLNRMQMAGLWRDVSNASQSRSYYSNIIVEFDPPLEKLISSFQDIANIINKNIYKLEKFNIKRLAFGYGSIMNPQQISLEIIEQGDFIIERRIYEAYSRNRYFCGSPTKTSEHRALLEEIERYLVSNHNK